MKYKIIVLNIMIVLGTQLDIINLILGVSYVQNLQSFCSVSLLGMIAKIKLKFKPNGLVVWSDNATRIYNPLATENFFLKRVFAKITSAEYIKNLLVAVGVIGCLNYFKCFDSLCCFKKIIDCRARG